MSRFKKLLEEEYSWPCTYAFKFIGPADQVEQVLALFSSPVDVVQRPSKHGRYTSLTVKASMQTPEEVILIYEEASKIKGMILL